MKSLMSAYEICSYIKLMQCVRRATAMDTVVSESSYYILRTESNYFK